jgi:hypothetical protein
MHRFFILAVVICLSLLAPLARAAPLQPALAGLDFLVGSWNGGVGKVAETGGTSKGTSLFNAQANGAVLLRQDHVALFDKAGKPAGGFDILMTIYSEQGAIHADYFDGAHIIHYTTAAIVPGKSVLFTTNAGSAAPAFRLIYRMAGNILTISFAMAPPGQSTFHPIADGTLLRSN